MGYFPNSTSWEFWAEDNCFKCAHWPRSDDDDPCAVEMAHMLHNYGQGDDGEDCPVRSILGMLIPREGIENKQCALFAAFDPDDADELERQRLASQPAKYEAALIEAHSGAR